MKKLVLNIILAGMLAACASEPPKEEVQEPVAAAAAAPEPAPVAEPVAPAAEVPPPVPADVQPESSSAFFPFDVDVVQAADRESIQAHGEYLSKHADARVRVEGNADERGSTEYNLALGQRRANNVRKALVTAGAKAAQVETVSFGEEKPRCADHDEACWSQNRRADIVAK